MLGSRFDLADVLDTLDAKQNVVDEASCLELEREIQAAVRTEHTARFQTRFRCPVCDDTMRVNDERALAEFGSLDVKLHRLECDTCGMLAGRVFHPSIGYDASAR